jgi:hypothetical protein
VPGLNFTVKVFSSSEVEMIDTNGGKYVPPYSRELDGAGVCIRIGGRIGCEFR